MNINTVSLARVLSMVLTLLYLTGCRENDTRNEERLAWGKSVFWETNKAVSSDITNWVVVSNTSMRGDTYWLVEVEHIYPDGCKVHTSALSPRPIAIGSTGNIIIGRITYDLYTIENYLRLFEPKSP